MELPDRPYSVRAVCAETTLAEASRIMIRDGVGSLLVKNDEDSPVGGILTDRDVVRVVSEGRDPSTTCADEFLGRSVETAPADADRLEWARKMRVHGIRRLPLTDEAGEICGIVSFDDLVFALGSELSELAGAIATGRRHAAGPPDPDL